MAPGLSPGGGTKGRFPIRPPIGEGGRKGSVLPPVGERRKGCSADRGGRIGNSPGKAPRSRRKGPIVANGRPPLGRNQKNAGVGKNAERLHGRPKALARDGRTHRRKARSPRASGGRQAPRMFPTSGGTVWWV